jgi:hypothetical protein
MDDYASDPLGGPVPHDGAPALKSGWKEILGLVALTAAAFLVHGFHPYSEDAESYLPGVEKVLDPRLFPVNPEYFQMHAHLTWFPQLIAYTVRLLHMPLPWVLLLWQSASFFLFLLACWHLMRRVFSTAVAGWSGVALVTALFTMPVAGTALYLMDPFLNPRNIIAFAEIFAVLKVLERRYVQAALLLVFGALIHPLMTAFSTTFCLLLLVMDRAPEWRAGRLAERERMDQEQAEPVAPALFFFAPLQGLFSPPTEAYEAVAANHRYQFLTRWTWYEMLGAIAPIFIFWGFGLVARARRMRNLELLSRAMAIYGVVYFIAGLAVSIPHRLEVFSLLQPMRSLRLLYVLMLLLGGGLLGEYVLRRRIWRWIALFLPLSAGMCWAQRALYPASAHIEWPQAEPQNPWVQAFEWARDHTPEDAVFAIDPYYMTAPGEDANGFRAIAQRSQLADGTKDSGVVEMFPQIADSWMAQVQAQTGVDQFRREDFVRLERQYGATWAVLRQPGYDQLDCPYKNQVVMVCRLP